MEYFAVFAIGYVIAVLLAVGLEVLTPHGVAYPAVAEFKAILVLCLFWPLILTLLIIGLIMSAWGD